MAAKAQRLAELIRLYSDPTQSTTTLTNIRARMPAAIQAEFDKILGRVAPGGHLRLHLAAPDDPTSERENGKHQTRCSTTYFEHGTSPIRWLGISEKNKNGQSGLS